MSILFCQCDGGIPPPLLFPLGMALHQSFKPPSGHRNPGWGVSLGFHGRGRDNRQTVAHGRAPEVRSCFGPPSRGNTLLCSGDGLLPVDV